jgi:hypothetical protein
MLQYGRSALKTSRWRTPSEGTNDVIHGQQVDAIDGDPGFVGDPLIRNLLVPPAAPSANAALLAPRDALVAGHDTITVTVNRDLGAGWSW